MSHKIYVLNTRTMILSRCIFHCCNSKDFRIFSFFFSRKRNLLLSSFVSCHRLFTEWNLMSYSLHVHKSGASVFSTPFASFNVILFSSECSEWHKQFLICFIFFFRFLHSFERLFFIQLFLVTFLIHKIWNTTDASEAIFPFRIQLNIIIVMTLFHPLAPSYNLYSSPCILQLSRNTRRIIKIEIERGEK